MFACNTKSFEIAFLFVFFLSAAFLDGLAKFFVCVPSVVAVNTCDKYRILQIANGFVCVVKIRLREHAMPCALETNRKGGFKNV